MAIRYGFILYHAISVFQMDAIYCKWATEAISFLMEFDIDVCTNLW